MELGAGADVVYKYSSPTVRISGKAELFLFVLSCLVLESKG